MAHNMHHHNHHHQVKNATPLHHSVHHTSAKVHTGEYIQTLILRTVGNFLVLSSLFLMGKTLYKPVLEEARFQYNNMFQRTYTVAQQNTATSSAQPTTEPAPGGFASLFNAQKIEVLVPEDPNYSVVIPKIGANAPVVSNVDPGNEEAYLEALKSGIAHARGTSFPGEGGHVFLFAHSTDYIWNIGSYNAVFYLLYKLEQNDEVNIFYQGQRYIYTVDEKRIIEPNEVGYLTRKTDYEMLTLQTCWPPGTTLKRLIVTARLKSD